MVFGQGKSTKYLNAMVANVYCVPNISNQLCYPLFSLQVKAGMHEFILFEYNYIDTVSTDSNNH